MKIIYNKIIPFGDFGAMNFLGIFLFTKSRKVSEVTLRHETIHSEQYKEMFYIGFLLWYCIEFVYRFIAEWFNKDTKGISNKWHRAYRLISFECEAYSNQYDSDYLKERKKYAWIQYIV